MFNHTIPKIILILLLLTALTGNLLDASPAAGFPLTTEEEMYPIFLPIVSMPPIVEHVLTSEGKSIGYPGYVWARGYISNVVPQPLYSVSIEVKFLYYPYCDPDDPDPCEPFEWSEIVHPAFPATLPGQVNPFFWERMLTKDDADLRQVEVISVSLKNDSGNIYYPLTVLNWHREDESIVGRVRNDSGKNLEDARVVVFSNQCDWKDATLIHTGLQSGQETDFVLDYCEEDEIVVIGQGNTSP